uniref:Uncharacterized protein n=1 Tax=Myoviridae sp. ctfvB24 TaxID=2826679 RepID=A0A8S5M950_9CAUD|nr:MAG TPA: hypothetical protein [Myoviridae sp. ctfvB24]
MVIVVWMVCNAMLPMWLHGGHIFEACWIVFVKILAHGVWYTLI